MGALKKYVAKIDKGDFFLAKFSQTSAEADANALTNGDTFFFGWIINSSKQNSNSNKSYTERVAAVLILKYASTASPTVKNTLSPILICWQMLANLSLLITCHLGFAMPNRESEREDTLKKKN